MHGTPRIRAQHRDLPDALAHPRLLIHRPLAGHDEVRSRNAFFQPRKFRKKIKARLQPCAGKCHQAKPQPASRPSTRHIRAVDPVLLLQERSHPPEATFRKLKLAQTLLRSVNARAPLRAEQRIANVNCNGNAQLQGRRRRFDSRQFEQSPPLVQFISCSVKKPPAERTAKPKTTVIRCAAANPYETFSRFRARGDSEESFPNQTYQAGMDVVFGRNKASPLTFAASTMANFCLAWNHHAARRVWCAASSVQNASPSRAEQTRENFPKPVTAIAHWQQIERITAPR